MRDRAKTGALKPNSDTTTTSDAIASDVSILAFERGDGGQTHSAASMILLSTASTNMHVMLGSQCTPPTLRLSLPSYSASVRRPYAALRIGSTKRQSRRVDKHSNC